MDDTLVTVEDRERVNQTFLMFIEILLRPPCKELIQFLQNPEAPELSDFSLHAILDDPKLNETLDQILNPYGIPLETRERVETIRKNGAIPLTLNQIKYEADVISLKFLGKPCRSFWSWLKSQWRFKCSNG